MGTIPQGGECRGDRSGRPVQQTSIDNGQLTIIVRRGNRSAASQGTMHRGGNVLRTGRNVFIILSKRQMNRLRMPVVAPKYGLVTGKALLGRFAKYTLTAIPFVSCLSVLFSFLFVPSRRSFHTEGRNFTRPESCPLGTLKNKNRWLFSYGRTTTTVRTRRYGGTDTSVRSQSQVLSTVERRAADAFFALETV